MSTIPPKCFCGMPIGHIYSVIKQHKDNSNPIYIGKVLDSYNTKFRTNLVTLSSSKLNHFIKESGTSQQRGTSQTRASCRQATSTLSPESERSCTSG